MWGVFLPLGWRHRWPSRIRNSLLSETKEPHGISSYSMTSGSLDSHCHRHAPAQIAGCNQGPPCDVLPHGDHLVQPLAPVPQLSHLIISAS